MANGNLKTKLVKRAVQWDDFLQKLIDRIEENGYPHKLFKPEIERLILKHSAILDIERDVVQGFQGIKKVNPEVQAWIKGKQIVVAR